MTKPRIAALTLDQMSTQQRQIHDTIANGPRGGVRGPLAVWLHRPEMIEHAQALGAYCRYGSSLPAPLSEWAILNMAARWRAQYEWSAHAPIALQAGVPSALIDALRDGLPLPEGHGDYALIHEFLTLLHERHEVSDALYRRLVQALGQDAVIDLVALAGYYTLISMTLKVFEI